MGFAVTCECGKTTQVAATQAGGALMCPCGKRLAVPALSALRKSAGDSYVPTSSIERIRTLIAKGELPPTGPCPLSGLEADSVIYLTVQCEQPWMSRDDLSDGMRLLFLLVGGFVGFFAAGFVKGPSKVFGHEVAVEIPLRVSRQQAVRIERMRQRRLKSLLSQTPAYKQLLREYPKARVTTSAAA